MQPSLRGGDGGLGECYVKTTGGVCRSLGQRFGCVSGLISAMTISSGPGAGLQAGRSGGRKSRWLLTGGIVAILLLLGLARTVVRHYRMALVDFEPTPPSQLVQHPGQAGVAGLQQVWLRSANGLRLAAWYVPSKNRAAVVVAHGTNADRSSMLPEIKILAAAGFGVLAVDWPGDGGSEGTVHWGPAERQTITAAVDWLGQRSDIDAGRIGGLGFSMGGYIMAQAAAVDPRLRAVVLAAAPEDFAEYVRWGHRRWGWFSQFPALLAVRRTGLALGEMQPRAVVGMISPRPVMIIGGGADPVIPPAMVRELYAAARQPKTLWIVPGAPHGQYDSVAPLDYPQRLVGFFGQLLH